MDRQLEVASGPRPEAKGARAAFARRFRAVRDARGLVQVEAAELFGVQQQTVARWEAGTAAPQRRLWAGVAEFLSLSVDELRRLLAAGDGKILALRPAEAESPDASSETIEESTTRSVALAFAAAVTDRLNSGEKLTSTTVETVAEIVARLLG